MAARPDGTTVDEWERIVHTWRCDDCNVGGASREPEQIRDDIAWHNRRHHPEVVDRAS